MCNILNIQYFINKIYRIKEKSQRKKYYKIKCYKIYYTQSQLLNSDAFFLFGLCPNELIN